MIPQSCRRVQMSVEPRAFQVLGLCFLLYVAGAGFVQLDERLRITPDLLNEKLANFLSTLLSMCLSGGRVRLGACTFGDRGGFAVGLSAFAEVL